MVQKCVNFLRALDFVVTLLNKLLKKLRDSGSMTRRTGRDQRRCVRSGASLVITSIGVASYGALGHVPPPRLPAS